MNNNTQSNKSIYTFYLYFSFSLVLLLPHSSFILLLQGGEPRGLRGGQADLGQPIAAVRPDGVPPGRVGFGSTKAPAGLSCVPRFRRVSFDVRYGASPSALEVHGDVFVCEHSAVHLLHFYVSKSLHSYMGGARKTTDLILIEG